MIEEKTRALLDRLLVVEDQLGDSEVFADPANARELGKEHAHLSRVKETWDQLQNAGHSIADLKELIKGEREGELQQMMRDEVQSLQEKRVRLQQSLQVLLVPPDPDDNRNTILELRAGTGGAEAALFVADCVRMYQLFADRKSWKWELLSATPSDLGGFKEYIMVVSGEGAHRILQHESGTHRVQRVPFTETQGRVHTSAITIAILLEPMEGEAISLESRDLRIDTYRSSGAGGQHVNTTDSAVRITDVETGTVVTCQEERSQHKNRDKAMRLLAAKLTEHQQRQQNEETASNRAIQVGSGDRSERIRTYNFPQNRVTDHRVGVTLYQLDRLMDGELEELAQLLGLHFQKQRLQEPLPS